MRAAVSLLMLGAATLALAGCKEKEAAAPPVRPVLSVLAELQNGRSLGFAGTVEPQYKVGFGFRVLGRIVARDVNVGDMVKRDQQLAAIDSVALELATRTAQADVANAQARLVNASGVLGRQQILLQQNTATQAEFDSAQQAQQTAVAMVSQAQANLAKAQEQLGYSKLRTDFDGIVTSVDAEVGEVVSPGQAVITVARPDIREAVVDVPEEIANTLEPGAEFRIALQIDPATVAEGKVREVAPQADATTRTRRVKITLQNPPQNFRLGTTITARPMRSANPVIHLPLSALLERDGKTMVWTVDPKSKTVNLQDIKVAARDDKDFQVAGGLAAGARVVVAGIHSLKPGQTVKIAQEANP